MAGNSFAATKLTNDIAIDTSKVQIVNASVTSNDFKINSTVTLTITIEKSIDGGITWKTDSKITAKGGANAASLRGDGMPRVGFKSEEGAIYRQIIESNKSITMSQSYEIKN